MQKCLLSILISISMLTPAFAQTTNAQKFSEAVQELEYNLTVEWDQKIQSDYDHYVNEFKKEVTKLKEEGLTNQDIIAYVKENYISQKKAQDFDELVTLSSSHAMSEELLMANISSFYKKGSSWDLGPDGPLIFTVTSIFVVTLCLVGALSKNED